jgi:DNA-binding transcriptional LysR family regulator
MPLVERTSKGPVLTVAGRRLVEHADAVFSRLHEAERELAEIAGLEGGRLRLATFPTAGATVVIGAVAAFRGRHPGVDVQLLEAEPDVSMPQLRAGEHDLALVFDFEGVPLAEDRDLEKHLLLEERMQLALPRGHRLASRRAAKVADLAEETWVIGTCAATCRDNVKLACRRAGFEPRIGFESDDYQVHQSLVAAGLAVSLVPELLLTGRHPGLAVVDIEPDAPLRRVWAITRPEETRSPSAEAMLEILREECERFASTRTGKKSRR